jgi:hypothetical protein
LLSAESIGNCFALDNFVDRRWLTWLISFTQ